MGWVKLDDGFSRHPKVVPAGPLGMAMQVAALCYCNQYLTDGFIPYAAMPTIMPFHGIFDEQGNEISWEKIASDLVELGVWYKEKNGYQIHDYGDFQPLKKEIDKERKAAQKRMQEARNKKKRSENVRPNKERTSEELQKCSPYPVPDPVPVPNNTIKTDREDIVTVSIDNPTGHSMSVCPSVNSDFILRDIGKRYQEKIGIMSSLDEQKLAEWVEMGMSPSLVAEAIDIAAAKGSKRVGFIVGILKNWYNDGHRNISDLVAAEKAREKAKQEQKGREPPGGGVPNALAYKPIDPEAVKKWREMHKDDYD